jgi:hypothetical protein
MELITRLRLQLKRSFDRIRNENLKKNALDRYSFLDSINNNGVFAVIYTKLFVAAENLSPTFFIITAYFYSYCRLLVL